MRKIVFVAIIIFVFAPGFSVAQTDCLVLLNQARKDYYNGNLREVLKISDCLPELNKFEKEEALSFLVNSLLLLGQDLQAEENMTYLLELNPTYESRGNDTEEFLKLYSKFKVKKFRSFGMLIGSNISDHKVMFYRSLGSRSEQPHSYTEKMGYLIGIHGSQYLTRGLSIFTALSFQYSRYEQSESILDFRTVEISENQSMLSVPIQLKYELSMGNWRPYVGIGMGFDFSIKSTASLRNTPLSGLPIYLGNSISTSDYDLTFQRTKVNRNIIGSIGFTYALGSNQFGVGLNYVHGLNNLVDEENRFNEQLVSNYGYIPDDFKRNIYQFQLIYTRSIFKSEIIN